MNIHQLQKELENHIFNISETARQFPWDKKEYYSMWLRQTYAFVCHSTRLLTLASAMFKDPAHHNRFIDHATEEKAHEKLLERDFKYLKTSFSDWPELFTTIPIYQIQYYWIQHQHPISLFGYILLLEGLAVRLGGDVYNKVKSQFGDSCCNFIRVHVEADQDHLPKAFKALEGATTHELELISKNLLLTSMFYHQSLKDILKGEWKTQRHAA